MVVGQRRRPASAEKMSDTDHEQESPATPRQPTGEIIVPSQMRQQRAGSRNAKQHADDQPDRQKFEDQRQWQLFEPRQVAGNFPQFFLQFRKKNIFVGRKPPAPDHVSFMCQQPPEFAVAAKRAARRGFQLIRSIAGSVTVRAGSFHRPRRHWPVPRRAGRSAACTPCCVRSFHSDILFADLVQHAPADGGMGAVDPDLALLEPRLALVFFRFQRRRRVQFLRSMAAVSCASLRGRQSPAIRRRSEPENPLSSFSSRAAKSRTFFFSASSSASISLTPGRLFTIAPHFFQQFLQFFHDGHRPASRWRKVPP